MHRCLGYDDAFLFVNQALPGTQELPSKKSASQLKDYWNQQLGAVASRTKGMPDHNPASMISLVGFKDDIIISHFVSNLRIGFEQNPVNMSDAPTMRAAMESFGKQTTAYVSGLGVAELYFSRIHKVGQMTRHAAGLYGQALGRLRTDLEQMSQHFSRSSAFLSLWTAYFLSLYELISSSRADGLWLTHACGVASLVSFLLLSSFLIPVHSPRKHVKTDAEALAQIEMLGPGAFQSPSANALYEVKRPFIVSTAVN